MRWFKQSTQARRLHLVIPDLLVSNAVVSPNLSLPALSQLLSMARAEPWAFPHFHSSLFQLFGFAVNTPPEQLPIAALSHLADTQQPSEQFYLRVDPVYLQADRDRLVLFDAHSPETLSSEETAQLLQEFNGFYAEEGLIFSAPHPKRWYVQLAELPDVTLFSVHDARGHDIRQYMPQGAQQMRWRNRLNEIQMLLHQSPVNTARIARQQLPINSLWFSGAGKLPFTQTSPWQQIWSNEEISQGLAIYTETPQLQLPDDLVNYFINMPSGNYLAVITPNPSELVDREQWLNKLEETWFSPLLQCIKQQQLNELWVYPCQDKVFNVAVGKFFQWLRKSKNWQAFLSKDTA